MIQTVQKNALVLEDGEQEIKSIKMSVDWESEEFLMQTLSKNFYSDSIGSTVRESCSNALDSHRRAGVTDIPIIVSLRSVGNHYEFSVEDRGTGLNYDDVVNILSKYGRSTARGDSELLGYMGFGFKAPMSYTSSFIFIIRKDGIERKCMMYDGEDGMKIDLLDENDTQEGNGVKVIISVNHSDKRDFFNKIKQQLCYFESIYFNVTDGYSTIDNNFKITRYKDFQVSELNEDNYLHLCLDNVYYPIDFDKLGIDRLSIPIALRFSLSDGIFPIPNRESIKYTVETKAIIIEKIKKVASTIIEMYNASVEDSSDINKIMRYYSNNNLYLDIGHKKNIKIDDLLTYSSFSPKEPRLTGVSTLNLRNLFEDTDIISSEYDIVLDTRRGKIRELKHKNTLGFWDLITRRIYRISERLGGVKREYMNSIIGTQTSIFVKKVRKRKLLPNKKHYDWKNDKNTYYIALKLNKYPKEQWRTVIKEFQLIQSIYEKNFIDVDKIEIPKQWLDDRKAKRARVSRKDGYQKLEGEISCKRAEALERYVDGKDCKFTPFSIDLKTLHQKKTVYIYTTHDDSDKLNKLYKAALSQKVTLITFSEREIKKANEINVHNLISYEKFMKGDNITFKRLVTAHLIHGLIEKNQSVFNNNLKNISTVVQDKLTKLSDYHDDYHKYGNSDLYQAMLEVAEKHSLFDHSIYSIYLEMKEFLDRFRFINVLCKEICYDDKNRDAIIIDLLKYHKYRVNIEHYKSVVQEQIIEEQLTEIDN